MHHAVLNQCVDVGTSTPVHLADGVQNRLPQRKIVFRRRGYRNVAHREHANDVGAADDPDKPLAAQNGNALDSIFLDEAGYFGNRRLFVDRYDVRRHDVPHMHRMALDVIAGLFLS